MKNTKKFKNLIIIAVFIALFIAVYICADRILTYKSEHGILQTRALYAQPRDTIDVVMLGSSHVHCNVNTAILWEDYGIAAYDYSGADQPMWTTYYYLVEMLKYQNPSLIVLDVYSPARHDEDYQYEFMIDNTAGMRFSANKLEMMQASCEQDKFFDYFPSISAYHRRYAELDKSDFVYATQSKRDLEAFKGYAPHFDLYDAQRPEFANDEVKDLTPKSEEYLMKIIDLAKTKGITLELIAAPYIESTEDQAKFNRIAQIAEQNGISFTNYNEHYDEIGINFATDFNDESHLNYAGSLKFTPYLADDLKAHYDIPDRRGDNRYESWDRNIEQVAQWKTEHEN